MRVLFHFIYFSVSLLSIVHEGVAFAAPHQPRKIVVVSGATGRVGSRVIKNLLKKKDNVQVVALVRNATKAFAMFPNEKLTVLEADFANMSSLELKLSPFKNDQIRLFLACGNIPDQANLELNVARAVGDDCFCVKLSTAQPLIENSVYVGTVHYTIEEELRKMLGNRCVILRPNIFFQMFDPDEGGSLLGVNARDTKTCQHVFANSEISMIDADDVALCASTILLEDDPTLDHGSKVYELTGPEAIQLSDQISSSIASIRSCDFTIDPCTLEQQVNAAGMPTEAIDKISPFVNTIGSYNTVTDTVEKLTGQPAQSVSNFVRKNPRAFLPTAFLRLVASGRAKSFREAAKVIATSLDAEIDSLEDDEILVRVQAAGVNGGADTFSVTNASDDDKDFLLGNEGAGVVILVGKNVTRYSPGDTTVFLASGTYGEYVRVKEGRCALVPTESTATPTELSALRISALTALVALQRTCPVTSDDTVLITACCGGTGHFAVQVAKAAGSIVIGTVGSTTKVGYATDLGVDRVIDLSKEELGDVLKKEYPQGIDIVYDGVGGPLLGAAFENLNEGGRILVVGSISQYPHNQKEEVRPHNIEGLGDIMDIFRSGQTVELEKSKKIIGNIWGDIFRSADMGVYRDRVFELNSKGKLQVLLDPEKVFVGIESVCDAVDHMLSRNSIGKVCVQMSDK